MRATKIYTGWQWLASHFPGERFEKFAARVSKRLVRARNRVYLVTVGPLSVTSLENGQTNSDESSGTRSRDTLPISTSPEPSLHHARTLSISTVRTPVAMTPGTPSIDEHQAFASIDEKIMSEKDRQNSRDLSVANAVSVAAAPPGSKFKALANKVIHINRSIPFGQAGGNSSPTPSEPNSPLSPHTPHFGHHHHPSHHHRRHESFEKPQRRPSRLATIVPALRALTTTQYLTEHTALVRHLQFSPNGEFFATCSWDQTAIIWKVGQPFTIHRKLAHAKGFVGQVAWSRDGKYLLTKMTRGVKVWVTEVSVFLFTLIFSIYLIPSIVVDRSVPKDH